MKSARLLWVVLGCVLASRADTLSTMQTVSVAVAPLGKVSVDSGLALTNGGTAFAPYTGALPVKFRVRTSPTGGGLVTVQASSDFSPRGGPSISAGGVTYTCTGVTLGTPCSGIQTLATGAQTKVVTIPGGVCTGGGAYGCSSADPNLVNVLFSVEDSPSYETANYAAQITFTISAI